MKKVIKHNENSKSYLHNLTCNKKCNHQDHKDRGFSLSLFSSFLSESISNKLEDNVKEYINIISSVL